MTLYEARAIVRQINHRTRIYHAMSFLRGLPNSYSVKVIKLEDGAEAEVLHTWGNWMDWSDKHKKEFL